MNDFKNFCNIFMVDNPILDCSNEMNKQSLILGAPTLNCSTKVSKRRQEKVPRPSNAFILYRKDKQFNVKNQYNLSNCQVSKVISQMWNAENNEIKLYYKKLANSKKLDHIQKYPNYVYKLKKRKKNTKNLLKINNMIATKTLSTLPFPHLKELSHDLSIINNINHPIPFNEFYPYTSNFNETFTYFNTPLNFNNTFTNDTFTYFENLNFNDTFMYFDNTLKFNETTR
ncbi:20029_t:CDS:1 [Gigaspora margarita]|uniref:20029_t:CDS:1 n=1 Tax=Gigaspora margarita TaxID=4874 RepID=A0ABN7WKS0_GIGMA|nr:20029_t:CDS:1 [Gigaspora margarita]